MNRLINFEIAKLLLEKSIDMSINTTIAEVVMWLYEKHGIWVVVNIALDDLWYFELYNLKDKRNAEILINHEEITEFHNSPTEAYSEAINFTLKNLIK